MIVYIPCLKTLMAKWLEQASQWHGMYCHDLKVMSSSPSRVELGVRGTSVLSRCVLEPKILLYHIPHKHHPMPYPPVVIIINWGT